MMFVALRGVTYFPQPPTLMAVVSSRNMNVVCSCTDEHAEEEGLKLRQVNISCYMYVYIRWGLSYRSQVRLVCTKYIGNYRFIHVGLIT